MDLETLKYTESLLLEAQGQRNGISNALKDLRSRISEIENRSPLTKDETLALQEQNASLQTQLDAANALIIVLGGPPLG